MNLDAFLYHLQYSPHKITPPDWQADWVDAPLAYKLYRGLPVFPLCSEVPLTLELGGGQVGEKMAEKVDLRTVGYFLWHAYGLTQIVPSGGVPLYRRPVPSGGGLFPSEVYVYLKLEEVPVGVYQYDAAHHRLVLLREGDCDSYLARALGGRCEMESCFGAVFVAMMFWKNFFKYNQFAYRLQGLDAGVLVGQLVDVARRFGVETGVCFQFLDRALNHLLGLSEEEESVYAVLPLASGGDWRAVEKVVGEPEVIAEPVTEAVAETVSDSVSVSVSVSVTADALCSELPALAHEHFVRSRRIREYPMLVRMNQAAMLESTASFCQMEGKTDDVLCGEMVRLPQVKRVEYDLAAVGRARFSPGEAFVRKDVHVEQVAALLQEVAGLSLGGRVFVYGCLHGVKGIPDGAYRYDGVRHALQLLRPGDHREWLQQGMVGHNVNLSQVPLHLHVAGDREHGVSELGYRGYRMQQMEAGMLVHRLLVTAIALGLGGHTLLGFDAGMADHLYHAARDGKTTLIHLPVGHYRLGTSWRSSMHG